MKDACVSKSKVFALAGVLCLGACGHGSSEGGKDPAGSAGKGSDKDADVTSALARLPEAARKDFATWQKALVKDCTAASVFPSLTSSSQHNAYIDTEVLAQTLGGYGYVTDGKGAFALVGEPEVPSGQSKSAIKKNRYTTMNVNGSGESSSSEIDVTAERVGPSCVVSAFGNEIGRTRLGTSIPVTAAGKTGISATGSWREIPTNAPFRGADVKSDVLFDVRAASDAMRVSLKPTRESLALIVKVLGLDASRMDVQRVVIDASTDNALLMHAKIIQPESSSAISGTMALVTLRQDSFMGIAHAAQSSIRFQLS